MTERIKAGWCQHCGVECFSRRGAEVFPHRPDLADKELWECPQCGARVGTHEAGKLKGKPLGTAANAELRRAREMLHGLVDPIWQNASQLPEYADARSNPDQAERMKALAIIKRTARVRVYDFMADGMGLTKDDAHIALLSLEECRQAWRLFQGVHYGIVREWAQARKAIEQQAARSEGPPQE